MYVCTYWIFEGISRAHFGNVHQDSSSACGNQDRRVGASASEGNGFNSSCQQCVAERAAAVAAEAVTVSSVSTSTSTEAAAAAAAATPSNRRNASSSSSVVLQGGTLERDKARLQQQQQPQSGGGRGMVFPDVPLENVFPHVEENR